MTTFQDVIRLTNILNTPVCSILGGCEMIKYFFVCGVSMAVIYVFNNCNSNIYFLRDTSASFSSEDQRANDPVGPQRTI